MESRWDFGALLFGSIQRYTGASEHCLRTAAVPGRSNVTYPAARSSSTARHANIAAPEDGRCPKRGVVQKRHITRDMPRWIVIADSVN